MSVQITVPLFAGGAVVTKVAQAQGHVLETDADLEAARRSAASDALLQGIKLKAAAGILGEADLMSLNVLFH